MIALSDGFHALFPWGLFLGIAALAVALLLPAWRRSALVLSSLSLLCLAEPVIFVTVLWMVPALFTPYGGAAEVLAWVGYGALPVGISALAMWLAYRRRYVVG